MTLASPKSRFIPQERRAQALFLGRDETRGSLLPGAAYRLKDVELNLAPSIRGVAEAYFAKYGITWHRHANHGLSSQVCCLNFLMPLATRPGLLSRLVGRALGIPPPRMVPVEDGPDGRCWFVGFEWVGAKPHLGEWKPDRKPTRGANVTSVDAVVRFEQDGVPETLFIEWKYTERYGAPLTDHRREGGTKGGNLTRVDRYGDKFRAPRGPIRNDPALPLEAFFFEPFYQLLRQQMLAWHTEHGPGERVRVLHISPSGNLDLHKITSEAFGIVGGPDAFDAFKAVLVPEADEVPRFINAHTEDVFGSLLVETAGDPWADYLTDRYTFLRRDVAGPET